MVLKLIDDAQTEECMRLALRLFVLVRGQAVRPADSLLVLKLLAEVLARQARLISRDMLQDTVALAVEQGRIHDAQAFRELLFSFAIWRKTEPSVTSDLLGRLRGLLAKTNAHRLHNRDLMAGSAVVQHFLDVLQEDSTPPDVAEQVMATLVLFLCRA